MSKLGFLAALLSAIWLTLAAVHSTADDTATVDNGDELQGLEIEHLQNSHDPAAWGAILERHASAFEEQTAAD